MIGKIVAVLMCAVACSAQMTADCGEVETFTRREPVCQAEQVYHVIRARDDCEPQMMQECMGDQRILFENEDQGVRVNERCDRKIYPIVLSNDAPETRMPPVIRAPPVSTPVRERPIIRLPSGPIPAPRVVSHKCLCTKTVIKPQVIQRVITVPRIQRYLRRGYRPVIEKIAYTAHSKTPDNFDSQMVAEPIPMRAFQFPPQFSQISSIC